MKRIYIILLALILLGAVGYYMVHRESAAGSKPSADTGSGAAVSGSTLPETAAGISPVPPADEVKETQNPLLPGNLNSILEPTQAVPVNTIPGSLTVFVNRDFLLPASYIPPSLTEPSIRFSFSFVGDKRKMRDVASDALEKMFRAAEKKGVILYGVSGYRSYVRQKQIYDRNVATRGRSATDSVSAMPGSSEHQTGLTIDISAQSVNCRLDQSFGNTREGRWVAKNAHKYGYVIRYPKGKTEVTGYHYEPWHIRYLGIELATYLYKNNLTLEEYYGINCNTTEADSGVDVEDPDTLKYATPAPSGDARNKKN